MTILSYILPFLIVLSVVVFIHELGHYLVARWNGVKIEVFSIGFGRELFGWTDKHETRWKVSLIPLGGYVKFFGDANEASSPTPESFLRRMTEDEKRVSFHHKRVGQRMAIVAAGPIANFVLAIVVFAGLFMFVGRPITVPSVTQVVPASAAAEAGFEVGDLVVSMDGAEIERFQDIKRIVELSTGEPITVVVERGGAPMTLTVTPKRVETQDAFGNAREGYRIGIAANGIKYVTHGPVMALWYAGVETVNVVTSTLTAVGQMITGDRGTEDLGGPLRIAQVSGEVAQQGSLNVIALIAYISVNLGLINLFPVPMLDGGHLLFYGFEALRGRPLGEKSQEIGFRIGLALVLTLMVFATVNDLMQLQVLDLVKGLFS